MLKNIIGSVVISLVFCLVLVAGGLFFYNLSIKNINQKLEKIDQRLSLLEVNNNSKVINSNNNSSDNNVTNSVDNKLELMPEPDSWQTYSNDQYGFSFDYPGTWKKVAEPKDYMANPKEIFKIEFSDPVWDQKVLEYNCKTIPDMQGCGDYLGSITDAEKNDISDYPKGKRNIFLFIYKDEGKDLETWLVDYFRIPDSQLETYLPGPKIVLAGKTGLLSTIGCCGGYDQSYVVEKDGYIYRLGTNYGADYQTDGTSALLMRIAGNAKFK